MEEEELMEQLPTHKDICPFEGDLDQEYAAKNFEGKTLEDAEALFRENCLFYGDDLMTMGIRGFEFYFQAFENYMYAQDSAGDFDVLAVLKYMESRFKNDELGSAAPLVIECLDYAINNMEKFASETEQAELVAPVNMDDLANDEEFKQICKETGEAVGIDPDELSLLWQNIPELDLSEDSEVEGLSLSDRFKKLRTEIAAKQSGA